MLDEHLALQVIHLVLDADRQQSLRLEGEGVAIAVVRTHLDPLRALHQLVDSRHREAALFDIGDAGRLDDPSITITRLCTSTWVAASPMPGAAYIVSARSATSFFKPSSNTVTGAASLCKRASG